jgi:hypothetical protein
MAGTAIARRTAGSSELAVTTVSAGSCAITEDAVSHRDRAEVVDGAALCCGTGASQAAIASIATVAARASVAICSVTTVTTVTSAAAAGTIAPEGRVVVERAVLDDNGPRRPDVHGPSKGRNSIRALVTRLTIFTGSAVDPCCGRAESILAVGAVVTVEPRLAAATGVGGVGKGKVYQAHRPPCDDKQARPLRGARAFQSHCLTSAVEDQVPARDGKRGV